MTFALFIAFAVLALGWLAYMFIVGEIEHRKRMEELDDMLTKIRIPSASSYQDELERFVASLPVAPPTPVETADEYDDPPDPIHAASRRAVKLLEGYNSEYARQYRVNRYVKIRSTVFPKLVYHLVPQGEGSGIVSAECYEGRKSIGYICVYWENDSPQADNVLQLIMMIEGGEEQNILANGNWNGKEDDCPFQYLYWHFNPYHTKEE